MTDIVKCQLCGKEGPKDGAHTCKGNPPTPEDVTGNLTLAGEQLFAGIDDRYVDGYQFAMLITFSTKEELAQAVRDRKVEFTLL